MEKQLETLKEKCSLVYSKRKSVLDAVFELNEMSPPDEFDYDKAIASIDSFFNDIDSYYELAKEYSEPNFFEIAGITRMETKHSRTIAYFLDANKNHGLGDMFVKKLLHNVISANKHINMSIEDLDVLDFSSFVIFLESVHNIDILMLSQKEKLAIIIENKVYATERIKGNDDGQLNKYRTLINHDYQDYKQLCIFLSPDGKAASDLDNWHIANYSMIVEAIEEILNDQNNNNLISYDIRLILRHYENMICRHLIPSKRIIKYSNKLIKKYPLALNLIYKFGPDMVSKATEYIKSFLSENAEILEIRIIEKNQHGFIYFSTKTSRDKFWDTFFYMIKVEIDRRNAHYKSLLVNHLSANYNVLNGMMYNKIHSFCKTHQIECGLRVVAENTHRVYNHPLTLLCNKVEFDENEKSELEHNITLALRDLPKFEASLMHFLNLR